MSFRKGIEKVQEAIERAGSWSGGSRRYFKWEPGETKVIRWLTDGDDIVFANLHEFVTCADGTKRSFVCRRDVEEECELCAHPEAKRREIAFGIAVWREFAKGPDGGTVIRTKTEEIEEQVEGRTIKRVVPWVGIVQQAPKNFWSWFWAAYDKSGTLVDRDYSITRRGQGMETTYQPFPEDKQDLDLRKFEEFKPDLEGMLSFLASKEYYQDKLHGIKADGTESDGTESDGTESNGGGGDQLSDEDLARLRRINDEVGATAVAGGDAPDLAAISEYD